MEPGWLTIICFLILISIVIVTLLRVESKIDILIRIEYLKTKLYGSLDDDRETFKEEEK